MLWLFPVVCEDRCVQRVHGRASGASQQQVI